MGFISKLFGNKEEKIITKEVADRVGEEDVASPEPEMELESMEILAQQPQLDTTLEYQEILESQIVDPVLQPEPTVIQVAESEKIPEPLVVPVAEPQHIEQIDQGISDIGATLVQDEETKESQVVSLPSYENMIVFSSYQEIVSISKDMSKIPLLQHLAATTHTMAHDEWVTREECEHILEQVTIPLQVVIEEIHQLSDPIESILELKRKCSVIANHTCLAKELTRETFLETKDFICIKDEVEVLNQFEKILPDIYDQSDPDFNKIRMGFIDTNNLHQKVLVEAKQQKEVYDKLVTEITNYTKVVNEAKVKYRLSVDWNGKKQPLMALGQQLNARRETFLLEEEAVNKDIISLGQIYPILHNLFRSHCRYFVNELDKKSQTYRYDDAAELKKNQLKGLYRDMLAVKSKLEYFLSQKYSSVEKI